MTDDRVRVPLDGKQVNLAQLSAEVGAPLSASDTEVVVVEGASVTRAQLAAAIAAHHPDPDFGVPAEHKRMRDLGKKNTLTKAETDEAIKLLLQLLLERTAQ